MKNMSFIKIDRCLINSYCFSNPNNLKIWIWMLLKANFKKTFASINIGRGTATIEVNRGQFIFGRFKAEEELDMNGSLIYRALKKFEELEQIIIETNNQYSLITICNYDSYQSNNSRSEQQTNNERTMNEQGMNISKEGLEGKEGKEESNAHLKNSNLFRQPIIPNLEEVEQAFLSSGGNKEMAKIFFDKNSATGWFLKGSPIVNFRNLLPSFIANFKTLSNNGTNKLTAEQKFDFYKNYSDRFD